MREMHCTNKMFDWQLFAGLWYFPAWLWYFKLLATGLLDERKAGWQNTHIVRPMTALHYSNERCSLSWAVEFKNDFVQESNLYSQKSTLGIQDNSKCVKYNYYIFKLYSRSWLVKTRLLILRSKTRYYCTLSNPSPQRGRQLAKNPAKTKYFWRVNKMAFSRFPSLNEEEISTLLSEKDSKSTKRASKLFKCIFEEYLHVK